MISLCSKWNDLPTFVAEQMPKHSSHSSDESVGVVHSDRPTFLNYESDKSHPCPQPRPHAHGILAMRLRSYSNRLSNLGLSRL